MTVQRDFPLSEVLFYKVGGKAKYFLTVESKESILQAIDFIKNNHIEKIFICGLGSNLIFSDDYFDGVVIQIASAKQHSLMINKDGLVESFAGEELDKLITFSFDNHLVGLEWAGGLPGTVGAGVRGNVGAFGGEIKDSLVEADVLDYSNEKPELKTLTNKQLQFIYRGSLVKSHKKMIVVAARFKLREGNAEEVASAKAVYEKNIQNRRDRHPLEYPNCGSVFKNLRDKEQIDKVLSLYPDLRENVEKKWYGKVAVASLIERLGLKGYRVGDAQVSEKHALFIVNLGNAKAKDVLQIINTIQVKFQEKFGFMPEVEAEVVL